MQNVTAVREVLCKDIAISRPYYNLGISRLCSPDYFSLFCVRLTDNMMCNLAVELAMVSIASTVYTLHRPEILAVQGFRVTKQWPPIVILIKQSIHSARQHFMQKAYPREISRAT